MGRLMMRCPKTQRPAFAGFKMDKTSTIRLRNVKVACKACGEQHDIGQVETWVEPDGASREAPDP